MNDSTSVSNDMELYVLREFKLRFIKKRLEDEEKRWNIFHEELKNLEKQIGISVEKDREIIKQIDKLQTNRTMEETYNSMIDSISLIHPDTSDEAKAKMLDNIAKNIKLKELVSNPDWIRFIGEKCKTDENNSSE